jgi:hypothetical protein
MEYAFTKTSGGLVSAYGIRACSAAAAQSAVDARILPSTTVAAAAAAAAVSHQGC